MDTITTIPLLPCRAIGDILTFYRALGFEVPYEQTHPNSYAIVRRGALELHFFGMREFNPADSYGSCIVAVTDVDALYQAFVATMRAQYGKILVSGIPRMTRLIDRAGGGRGFNLIDPGGNWIRFAQPAPTTPGETAPRPSKLALATETARILSESSGDYAKAARTLDNALAKHPDAPLTEHTRGWIVRAGIALAQGERALAAELVHRARAVADENPLDAAIMEELAHLEQILEQ